MWLRVLPLLKQGLIPALLMSAIVLLYSYVSLLKDEIANLKVKAYELELSLKTVTEHYQKQEKATAKLSIEKEKLNHEIARAKKEVNKDDSKTPSVRAANYILQRLREQN